MEGQPVLGAGLGAGAPVGGARIAPIADIGEHRVPRRRVVDAVADQRADIAVGDERSEDRLLQRERCGMAPSVSALPGEARRRPRRPAARPANATAPNSCANGPGAAHRDQRLAGYASPRRSVARAASPRAPAPPTCRGNRLGALPHGPSTIGRAATSPSARISPAPVSERAHVVSSSAARPG